MRTSLGSRAEHQSRQDRQRSLCDWDPGQHGRWPATRAGVWPCTWWATRCGSSASGGWSARSCSKRSPSTTAGSRSCSRSWCSSWCSRSLSAWCGSGSGGSEVSGAEHRCLYELATATTTDPEGATPVAARIGYLAGSDEARRVFDAAVAQLKASGQSMPSSSTGAECPNLGSRLHDRDATGVLLPSASAPDPRSGADLAPRTLRYATLRSRATLVSVLAAASNCTSSSRLGPVNRDEGPADLIEGGVRERTGMGTDGCLDTSRRRTASATASAGSGTSRMVLAPVVLRRDGSTSGGSEHRRVTGVDDGDVA
jgi:hypothetical protein